MRILASYSNLIVDLDRQCPQEVTPPNSVYTLKVTLCGVKPRFWQQLHVADTTTMAQLHAMIQALMGWETSTCTVHNWNRSLPARHP